ncbi:MAG: hypothetical protein OMM_09520 [Candidatus Magnetoglobus multicellularis str. Araruama]|jgi:uncharacterized DUF497 family protein|uniref:Toxin n=1 Tax=Candidatus Magnetoglobus multicellularis str. Araruama TaxID=890399 RepID=A0A1V1P3Z8_9BACT|nr:MAG: hypothetical protein OMM_09520 [Candidatus Magnetoglobus multicellularis str. Araruama]
MKFDFNDEKNTLLLQKRGITFQSVIKAINKKGILTDFKHPNEVKYPNQRIFVVEVDGYTYCVPYIEDGDIIFMKTIFPNRKFMKLLETK